MTNRIYFSALILVSLLSLPGLTYGYTPFNQSAETVGDYALFSLETTINPTHTLRIPVRGSTQESTEQFTYELFSDTSGVFVEQTFGLILTDAPLVDGYYELAPNTPTRIKIFMVAKPLADADRQQLRARITNLPLIDTADLNQFELAGYVTPKTTI